MRSGAVVGAVGLAGWIATDAASGWLRVVLGLVTLAALAYAGFTLGLVALFLVLRWVVDGDGPLAAAVRRRWCVWMVVPILVGSWAGWDWLAGYDAAEWAWTGACVGTAILVLLVVLLPSRSRSFASTRGVAARRAQRERR